MHYRVAANLKAVEFMRSVFSCY